MEKKDTLIKGINLQIGKKEIQLSVEEAKELKKALEELFGEKIVKEEHHHYNGYTYYPYWRWPTPYIYCGTSQLKYDNNSGVVNCSLNAGGTNG